MVRPAKTAQGFRLLTWIGIIDQLATDWAKRRLEKRGLTMAQFAILLHMTSRPHEEHTVSRLAYSFQQPQPGVTKNVQALLANGSVRDTPHASDGRVKILSITAKGRKLFAAALKDLEPGLETLFAEWCEDEIELLTAQLDRLKKWLDTKGRA